MTGICKSFHGFRANIDVNLKIETGEILGLSVKTGPARPPS
jgi:ABC-type uncharacterized transport system ATPase subunit